MKPRDLSSIRSWSGSLFEYDPTEPDGTINFVHVEPESFDLANLNWPVPASVYQLQPRFNPPNAPWNGIVFNDYNPQIVVPDHIRNLDPAWEYCELDWQGMYDPPRALQPADAVAGPTTPAQYSLSRSATPSQTIHNPTAPLTKTSVSMSAAESSSEADPSLMASGAVRSTRPNNPAAATDTAHSKPSSATTADAATNAAEFLPSMLFPGPDGPGSGVVSQKPSLASATGLAGSSTGADTAFSTTVAASSTHSTIGVVQSTHSDIDPGTTFVVSSLPEAAPGSEHEPTDTALPPSISQVSRTYDHSRADPGAVTVSVAEPPSMNAASTNDGRTALANSGSTSVAARLTTDHGGAQGTEVVTDPTSVSTYAVAVYGPGSTNALSVLSAANTETSGEQTPANTLPGHPETAEVRSESLPVATDHNQVTMTYISTLSVASAAFTVLQESTKRPEASSTRYTAGLTIASSVTSLMDHPPFVPGTRSETKAFGFISLASTGVAKVAALGGGVVLTVFQQASGVAVIAKQTISTDGPPITISGYGVTMATNGLYIESLADELPPSKTVAPGGLQTFSGAVFAAASGTWTALRPIDADTNSVVISETTLSVGGPALMVGGDTVSIAPQGLVVGGRTRHNTSPLTAMVFGQGSLISGAAATTSMPSNQSYPRPGTHYRPTATSSATATVPASGSSAAYPASSTTILFLLLSMWILMS